MYLIFNLLLLVIGKTFLSMNFFEIFVIICLAGIIVKLTDIEETLEE